MIELPDHDAIELAELLDWLTEFLITTPTITAALATWADNPTALHDLTHDLNRWTHQLRTTTPT